MFGCILFSGNDEGHVEERQTECHEKIYWLKLDFWKFQRVFYFFLLFDMYIEIEVVIFKSKYLCLLIVIRSTYRRKKQTEIRVNRKGKCVCVIFFKKKFSSTTAIDNCVSNGESAQMEQSVMALFRQFTSLFSFQA